jgi:hypothetical protein
MVGGSNSVARRAVSLQSAFKEASQRDCPSNKIMIFEGKAKGEKNETTNK